MILEQQGKLTAEDRFAAQSAQELIELQRVHGHGFVGGVEFDFSHPGVDENWGPLFESGAFSGVLLQPQIGSIRLQCPWTRHFNSPEMKVRGDLHGRALLRHIVEFGPDVHLNLGDKLYIRSVKRTTIQEGVFAAEPDNTALHVRFEVRRVSGVTEKVRGKCVYFHKDRDWGDRTLWIAGKGYQDGLTLEAIERRLNALMRPTDLDEDGDLSEDCDVNISNCWDALSVVDWPVKSARDRDSRDRALIRAGYFLAKAEAVSTMLPHAQRGLESVRGGARGGRSSGEQRRRWVAENWEPHALQLATKKRLEMPRIGQADLASEIQFAWTKSGKAPGHGWLLDFVRAAEKDGRLARRSGAS